MRRSTPVIAEALEPIGLEELTGTTELLDRVDVKYVVPVETMSRVIERLRGSHRVLTIDERTRFEYWTTYFDAPELTSFREHVQRRRRRFKCRTRHYVESGHHAFEVKLKGPRGRTLKRRMPCEPMADGPLGEPALGFLRDCLAVAYGRDLDATMVPALSVAYHRVTLAAPELGERLTCDLTLRFGGADGRTGRLRDGLAIVESKSGDGRAAADRALLALGARPVADCSKYCLGIALTRPDVRSNRFRPLMRRYFSPGVTRRSQGEA